MKDRVVIITGGGSGIGFGIAQKYAEKGANIVITGRTKETLENAAKQLRTLYGATVLPIVADGSKPADVKNAVKEVVAKFGRIDALLNNAQSSVKKTINELSLEDFELTISSNLYATFLYMQECYPYLKETKGSVINFASGAGFFGKYEMGAYGAAKEAIRGLSRTAANEWGPDEINVNVIVPLVLTDAMKKYREMDPEGFQRMVQPPPFGRFGDSKEDVGSLCIFLSSKEGKFISGETISIQGGNSLRP